MSKKAEELSNQFIGHPYEADEDFTITLARSAYRQGYEQAEKDLISLIESRIGELLGDAQPTPILRIELRELIDKIKGQ